MTGHANRSKAVKGDPFENLANAIILQAVSDYRRRSAQYRRHGKPNREMRNARSSSGPSGSAASRKWMVNT
jgi:hypothetical protein